MKTILIAMACAIASLNLSAQSQSINNFFDAVPKSENIFRLELSGFFLDLAANMSDDEESKILKGIKSIRLISADDLGDLPDAEVNRLTRGLRAENFEPLAEIRDGGDKLHFMIKEKGDVISDFVAKIQDKDGGFLLISIEGAFRYEDLQNLDVDIEGMDQIKKAPKDYPRA